MEKLKIAVIGGGLMGMSLANKLACQDHEITLIEAEKELGGLVSSAQFGIYTWDKFYHVILLSDSLTRDLMCELGLENQLHWKETKTGFFTDGKLYSMSNTLEFLTFPPLGLIDKFRLAITILYASMIHNPKKLESIPVTHWLKKWSGKRTYEKIWLPLLRAKLGDGYTRTSAAFIWATIQRLYGARKSGLKKEMFGYIDEGYSVVLKRFTKLLQSKEVIIKTSHQVSAVTSIEKNKFEVIYSNHTSEWFDKVVVTLPSDITAAICHNLSDMEKAILKKTEYLGVICVSVLLDKPLSPFYVTNVTETWIPFTGVIEMTAIVNRDTFGGNALVYLPKYLTKNDPLINASDKEITTLFIDCLKKMYPQLRTENIRNTSVARAGRVIALPSMNYSSSLLSVKTSVPGLYVINSSLITDGTLNVNETLKVSLAHYSEILYPIS